jgi:hypothetical protein
MTKICPNDENCHKFAKNCQIKQNFAEVKKNLQNAYDILQNFISRISCIYSRAALASKATLNRRRGNPSLFWEREIDLLAHLVVVSLTILFVASFRKITTSLPIKFCRP